jgi:hypothetical protein
MEFCADDDGDHSSEKHSDQAVCHCHQAVVNNASSAVKEASEALNASPVYLTHLIAFGTAGSSTVLEAPPHLTDEPTQTDFMLRSSRLLI